MKIAAINNFYAKKLPPVVSNQNNAADNTVYCNKSLLSSLDFLAAYNSSKISFKSSNNFQESFELNYSLEELKKRTSKEAFTEFRMLEAAALEFKQLKDCDKQALIHLIKAAKALDSVYIRQQNIHSIPFNNYLEKEIEKGSQSALLTKRLYDAQKCIIGKTVDGKPVLLAKGIEAKPGKGFYPEDLTEKEFHKILEKMLKDGEAEEVRKILNQRSMVFRSGDKLKAVDFTDYFKKEFTKAAYELEMAASLSSDKNFNNYLMLQAKALLHNNPEYDSLADKAWAKLQYTPLEFTIGRECYDDKLTPTVTKNKKLEKMLKKYDITPYAKDSIGVRVGIVNKEGTDYILKIKEFLPMFAQKMPYSDKYEQTISKTTDTKQTMVDADIVLMTGEFGRYTGSVSIASNLPNNDKLSVQTGGGKRNVYHRQIRQSKSNDTMSNTLDVTLDKSQQKYCDENSLHDYTILHENVHSLGPKKELQSLGLSRNIIEEHKADMGAMVMLDELVKTGFYTKEREKQIITSYIISYLPKEHDISDAHRTRNLMQYNYFISHGAIKVSDEGRMKIDYKKIIECSHQMLEKAVQLQLSGDAAAAEKYIKEYTGWTDEMEKIAKNLRTVKKKMNSYLTYPLADKLVSGQI